MMRTLNLFIFAVFSTSCWAQQLNPDRVYPPFWVGTSGLYVSIEKQMQVTVKAVANSSSAADSDLAIGDVLISVGGRNLSVKDPRVPMGEAIGDAEATDGKLSINVLRGTDEAKVELTIPVLGSYSDNWPANCKKSDTIINNTAKYVAASQLPDGTYKFKSGRGIRDTLQGCLTSLFLLSTGDDIYLPNVRLHAHHLAELAETRKNAGGHVNWQLGYQGIFLCEYYLRTGDRQVLAGLQELCDWCIDNQAAGGWGHGEGVGPGYVQSGLMNHAGVPILITLILSQECGIKIDPTAYAQAMELMYRMAGHGCIAYGDHRSELWWSNTNGRNAMLACAFSLLKEHPQYLAASQHLARLVTDSYFQPEFGHTGGGFNVIWRGIASVHVPKTQMYYYHRQMKILAWYYDLTRQPDGGFSILPTPPDNGRYSGVDWGTGAIGLTYTAPRRKLRITGAPRTQHSIAATPPAFEWGNENDLQFFSTFGSPDYGPDIDHPDKIYTKLLEIGAPAPTVSYCSKYLRHYSPLVRTWAGRRLGEMKTPKAIEALQRASLHSDPRVRRAAFDAISGYDNWQRPIKGRLPASVISAQFLEQILQALKNDQSAWWEIDGALFALGQAEPSDIRKNLPLIRKFCSHEDWYLREAAFWAITGLHADITGQEFGILTQMYEQSQHVFERASFDSGFQTILINDKAAFDRASLINSAKRLGKTTHDPKIMLGYGTGGVHEAAHRTMMVLKHFNPDIYPLMIGDFTLYLKNWEPYYQHSIWLIKGSKWQPGILNILENLGPEGRPIVNQLERITNEYGNYDQTRIPRDALNLRDQIVNSVNHWKEKQAGQ
ncbi:DUF6288 domain-containing protein [bacterium]|nr:DUF6288 domain-containing protein [bacterium]